MQIDPIHQFEINNLMPFGTPAQVIEKLQFMRETINMDGIMCNFGYAGMPIEEAERNMKCFAEKVMPEVKKWQTAPLKEGAELNGFGAKAA